MLHSHHDNTNFNQSKDLTANDINACAIDIENTFCYAFTTQYLNNLNNNSTQGFLKCKWVTLWFNLAMPRGFVFTKVVFVCLVMSQATGGGVHIGFI